MLPLILRNPSYFFVFFHIYTHNSSCCSFLQQEMLWQVQVRPRNKPKYLRYKRRKKRNKHSQIYSTLNHLLYLSIHLYFWKPSFLPLCSCIASCTAFCSLNLSPNCFSRCQQFPLNTFPHLLLHLNPFTHIFVIQSSTYFFHLSFTLVFELCAE